MKKRPYPLTYLIALCAVAFLFMACRQDPADAANADTEGGSQVEVEGNTTAITSASIQIDHASDELLGRFGTPYTYTVDGNGVTIVIWTDAAVRDFRFFEIGNRLEENTFVFFADAVLCTIDELSPDKPFVVKMNMPEILPTHGISYIDVDGAAHEYCILESGQDGSLFIVKF